jgi:hypothetical protein
LLTRVIDDKTGEVILYDIWVNGKWAGSRRTIPQATQELKNQNWPSWVLADGEYHIEQGSPARIVFDDVSPASPNKT